jgi:hypothetical protein
MWSSAVRRLVLPHRCAGELHIVFQQVSSATEVRLLQDVRYWPGADISGRDPVSSSRPLMSLHACLAWMAEERCFIVIVEGPGVIILLAIAACSSSHTVLANTRTRLDSA